MILGLNVPSPKKILHLLSFKMLNFRPFFSLNLYVYEFWSLARPLD